MKKFMLLHYGFEKPTQEIMQKWGAWFETNKPNIIDMGGHFMVGREISNSGTQELPLGKDSITGYNIVQAESMDAAEKIAASNPYIASIRVYEMKTQ